MTAAATATVLTAPGRGAISVVRVCAGPQAVGRIDAWFSAANGRVLGEQPIGRVCFGKWSSRDETAHSGEEVVLTRINAETVEIGCHGGRAAVRRILDDLAAAGFEEMSWQDTIGRRQGLLAAELTDALSRASTLRTANVLLRQSAGLLKSGIERLLTESPEQRRASIERMLRWADFGLHLVQPWRVVLFGPPNVGKSSLINAIVGYGRALVFDRPGTTRDIVTAEAALDGWPIQFADTAGLHDSSCELEAAGIAQARDVVDSADLRILVTDEQTDVSVKDHSRWPERIVVQNKVDLLDSQDAVKQDRLPCSALTGAGVDKLCTRIVNRLVPDAPPPDQPIPVTTRQVELLRAVLTADKETSQRLIRELLDG